MKRAIVLVAVFGLASTVSIAAGGKGTVTGQYVEARTAEVFTGGCVMGSEAETMGSKPAAYDHRADYSEQGARHYVTGMMGQ